MSDALTQLNLPDETKDMLGLALALTLYCQDDDKWEKKFGEGEKGVLLTMRKSRLRVDLGNKIVVSIAGGSWNTNCQIPVNIVELSKEQIGEVSDALSQVFDAKRVAKDYSETRYVDAMAEAAMFFMKPHETVQ